MNAISHPLRPRWPGSVIVDFDGSLTSTIPLTIVQIPAGLNSCRKTNCDFIGLIIGSRTIVDAIAESLLPPQDTAIAGCHGAS